MVYNDCCKITWWCIMITWPACTAGMTSLLPVLPLAKFNFDNFDILVPQEGPVLHSIALSDASRCGAKKKNDEIRLIGSWDLGVLFLKVLPTGHNAGWVINNNHLIFFVYFLLYLYFLRKFLQNLYRVTWKYFWTLSKFFYTGSFRMNAHDEKNS